MNQFGKWIVALAVLLVVFGTSGWIMLERLPSRQLARFPQFIQTMIIAEPESAILPTPDVEIEIDTAALLTLPTPSPTVTLFPTATPTATDIPPTTEATSPPATETPTNTPTPTATAPPTNTPAPTAEPLPVSYRMGEVVHHTQDWNNCGPATLAMGLSYFGATFTQYDTAAYLKPNDEDRNVSPYQMAEFVSQRTDFEALDRVNGDLDLLRTLIANDFPVIIEIGLDPPGEVAWLEWYGHYLLATGYDDEIEELWVFDSLIWTAESLASTNSTEGRVYTYAELEQYWPHFNNTFIVLYDQARADELEAILGDKVDDQLMWEQALVAAQGAVEENSEDAFAWFNLGTAYTELGQFERAATAFDKARSISLPWRMLWYQFGPYEAYYETGRYVDVVLLANTTLKDRPYFEESFYWRGLAQAALGDTESALASLQAAADFNPNFAPAVQALADIQQDS